MKPQITYTKCNRKLHSGFFQLPLLDVTLSSPPLYFMEFYSAVVEFFHACQQMGPQRVENMLKTDYGYGCLATKWREAYRDQ
jgi:hypothetical protein